MWYVLDVNPEPWAIGPLNVVRKNGKYVPFVGRNTQLDDYKKTIIEELTKGSQEVIKLEGKVKLTFLFWRTRADYQTWQARHHRKHEADLTNLIKSTEDALQGVLFDNDRDTNEVTGYIIEQGPDVKGRIVFCIEPASDTPAILNNLPDYVHLLMNKAPVLFEEDTQYSNSDPRSIF